jgi:enterochelin esterase family protein
MTNLQRRAGFCLLAVILVSTQVYAQFSSPRISALQNDLEAGNGAALEKFWKDVKQGGHLIEPIVDNDGYRLVTFLWRAKEEVKSVAIVGGVAGDGPDKNQMARLRDTDLWFKTYRVRNDARFSYRFLVNPRPIPDAPTLSVELPGAPQQTWITRLPNVPAGQIEWKKLKSAILNNERNIGVYTPPGYRTAGQPYGMLVLFDGEMYDSAIPTPVILDNLLARNLLPPLVAVMITNPTLATRNVELMCNADFVEFLAKELIPWVRQNYHVTADPNQTAVGGASLGGLTASFTALRHPEIFGNVLSQSGSYWWKPRPMSEDGEHEWLTKHFITSQRLPVRFYLDVGLMEKYPSLGYGPSMVHANRHMRDVLLAKGYDVHYRESNADHEPLNWRGTLSDGLLLLFGKETKEKKDR